MRLITAYFTVLLLFLAACKEYENEVSAFEIIAQQLKYENFNVTSKHYVVANESIKIIEGDYEKLLSKINNNIRKSVEELVNNINKDNEKCRFDALSDFPFLYSEENSTNVDRTIIAGVFSLSCISYDSENNIGLYYFRYTCGLDCGESGFVIFSKVLDKVRINEIIYTGIS